MLAGALTGGLLLRWVALAAPLWLAAVLLVDCSAFAYAAAGRPQSQLSRGPQCSTPLTIRPSWRTHEVRLLEALEVIVGAARSVSATGRSTTRGRFHGSVAAR
jgi:hypothetical protein